MAIWNYRYYLIPSATIRNKFNANKDIILDEYRSNGFQNFNENKSFENYFIDNDVILLSIINEAKKQLKLKESWDKDAIMFCDNFGNSLTVWPDDIECELDLRFDYIQFIQKTIDWAIKYNCLFVIEKTGNVVSPNINNLMYEIKAYLESKPWPI